MRVSVIIPTYNRAACIARAVESVLTQTYREVEAIVVDDGSTDETAATLARYGPRIRVIHQANAGPSAARNRGIKAATGELIAFLDSDDEWMSEKLRRQVSLLDRCGSAVTCCLTNAHLLFQHRETTSFDAAGISMGHPEGILTNVFDVLLTRPVFFTQAAMVRRSAVEGVGGFSPHLRILEDYELALRLATTGSWALIREPMVRWNGGSELSLTESARHDRTLTLDALSGIFERLRCDQALSGTRRYRVQLQDAAIRWETALQRQPTSDSRFLRGSAGFALRLYRALLRRPPFSPRATVDAAPVGR